MKTIILLIIIGIAAFLALSFGKETTVEKVEVESNKLHRTATEEMHRIEESVCADSDGDCLVKKIQNRTQEAAQIISDKSTELKNKLDD